MSHALHVVKDISPIHWAMINAYVDPSFTMLVTYALTIRIVSMHINKMEMFYALSAILFSFMWLIQWENANVKNFTNKLTINVRKNVGMEL